MEEWARASRVMEEDRRAGIRGVVTAQALRNFTGAVADWLDTGPEVPKERWFHRCRGMTVFGEGELVKTFLTPGQVAYGKEV